MCSAAPTVRGCALPKTSPSTQTPVAAFSPPSGCNSVLSVHNEQVKAPRAVSRPDKSCQRQQRRTQDSVAFTPITTRRSSRRAGQCHCRGRARRPTDSGRRGREGPAGYAASQPQVLPHPKHIPDGDLVHHQQAIGTHCHASSVSISRAGCVTQPRLFTRGDLCSPRVTSGDL